MSSQASHTRALPEARVPLPQGSSQDSSLQPLMLHPAACPCLQGWCNSVHYRNPTSHLRKREGMRARRSSFFSGHIHHQNASSKAYLQFLSFSHSSHSLRTNQSFTVLLRLLQRLPSPEAETTYQNCPQISPCLHTPLQCPDHLTITFSGQRALLPLVTNSRCCNAHLASSFFATPPCQCHMLAITPG